MTAIAPADPGAQDEQRRGDSRRRAQERTTRLGVFLVLCTTAALAVRLPALDGLDAHRPATWWMIAVGFAFAEYAVFHIEVDDEAHTFSLSEIPTVIGLLFAPPAALIVGRLVGEAVTLVVRDRQTLPKLIFNLSMFLSEVTVALVIFSALAGSAPLHAPRTWLAALVAVAAADTVGIVCVTLAIHWHGGHVDPKNLLKIGAVTAGTNTSIAIAGALLLSINPIAGVLIAALAAIAFFAYRAFAALTQRYASLQLLYDFTTVVGRSMSADEVLQAMLDQARALLRAGTAEIMLLGDDERPARIVRSGAGAAARHDERDVAHRKGVVRDGSTVVVPRNTKDEAQRSLAEAVGAKDLIVAPLMGEGRVIGSIAVFDRLGDVSTFDAEDGRLFETLANHASVALENGRLLDRLSREVKEREHQALHDSLTGLPNRANLFRTLRQLIAERHADDGAPFAVMLMDLDRFKDVNDSLGHHWGDLLLQEVAHRLAVALPSDAVVARLGGDEFALVLPGVSTPAAAELLAGRVLASLGQPCYLEDISVEVGASIGTAFWPTDGNEAATLLKRADIAMYSAKGSTKRMAVYDRSTSDASPRRLALVSALREAIDGDELEVHYQPKVRLADDRPVGVEALVRWRHAELGFVSPDEFIPIAEQTGLINALTDAVLTKALRQCRAWETAGLALGVAVNVSVRTLADERFADVVAARLAEHGVAPHRLTIEITETGVMTDPRRTVGTLHALADLGVRLSIDDFGTGYSSLAYLQRLPVHEVKIDRSFVMTIGIDEGDVTIVRSIVDLGRNLSLQVVAEGVEDELALQQLVAMGCDVAQGYHLSRPVDAEALERWVRERTAGSTPPLRVLAV